MLAEASGDPTELQHPSQTCGIVITGGKLLTGEASGFSHTESKAVF